MWRKIQAATYPTTTETNVLDLIFKMHWYRYMLLITRQLLTHIYKLCFCSFLQRSTACALHIYVMSHQAPEAE